MMFALIYVCCLRTGCNAINWVQKKVFAGRRDTVVLKPMTRHTSIVTFMQLNTMLWALYLVMIFCYAPGVPGRRASPHFCPRGRLLGGCMLHVQEVAAHPRLGAKHPHGHCHCHCALDLRGGDGAQAVLQRNLGGTDGEHRAEMDGMLLTFIVLATGLFVRHRRIRK